jgi:hypothetical protein
MRHWCAGFFTSTAEKQSKPILPMAGLWLVIGVLIGIGCQPLEGIVTIVSGALAGALLLPWLGILLGVLGGGVAESALGAMTGGFAGIFASVIKGEVSFVHQANIGIFIGGVMGANFATVLAWRAKAKLTASDQSQMTND